jgi:VWFA-related protein
MFVKTWRRIGTALLPAFLAAPALLAQSEAALPRRLRANANLVLIPVAVCDDFYRPVTNLSREQFRVFDEGVEQTITHFAREDEPLAVGLVFDISRSMGRKFEAARKAAEAFFQHANPEDEFFLVEFNDGARLVAPLTGDVHAIQERLLVARPEGRTALLDAVYLALNEVKKSGKRRKALLIFSDGGDNASRYTRIEVKHAVEESDVMIYAVGVFDLYGNRRRSSEEVQGPVLLRKLAELSGGRMIPVVDSIRLPYIAVKISIELRNRYLLGYAPTAARDDGRYHHVQVKVVPPPTSPPLRAYWRMGYFAPGE